MCVCILHVCAEDRDRVGDQGGAYVCHLTGYIRLQGQRVNHWPVRYIARVVSSNGVVRITAISEASSTATPLPKESRDSFVEVASSCIEYILSSLFHLNSVFVHRGEEENGLLWRRWTDFDKSVICHFVLDEF